MTLYTETEQDQWMFAKQETFTIVKEDQLSLGYLLFYLKKQYQEKTTVRHVRAEKCKKLVHLMDEWAAALQFPLYFGRSLNAFLDCIRYLPVANGTCQVIVVTKARQILMEDSKSAKYFWEILQDVAQLSQSGLSKPFQFIFQAENEEDKVFLQNHLQQWGIICDYWKGDWANLYVRL